MANGVGVVGSVGITVVPSANTVKEVEGNSLDVAVDVGIIGKAGGVISFPIDDKGTVNYNLRTASYSASTGFGVSGMSTTTISTTQVYDFYEIRENLMKGTNALTTPNVITLPNGLVRMYGNGQFDVW
jgi:hypothetical protein